MPLIVEQHAGVSASILAAPLIDGPVRQLDIVHVSRRAWQLATEDAEAVTSVIFPGAVRLPSAIAWPERCEAPSSVSVGDGAVTVSGRTLRVSRWWRPARPHLPTLRDRVTVGGIAALAQEVPLLLGRGPGLTPYGDDILCGALAACRAAAAEEGDTLVEAVRRHDLERRTTATSALLLRQATEGYCIDEVAVYLRAIGVGHGVTEARQRLLAVGHTSGAGLVEGVHRVVSAGEHQERAA